MNILIVESKAKCKTLLRYLGKDEWRVMPTGGHVERLAEDRKLHPPKEVRKAYWSHRPNELPSPPWFWTERGEAAMRAIFDEAAKHDQVTFYLAADPDREGERIAWHLEKLLSPLGPCKRVTFQEITKPAVLAAVAAPGRVDQQLVDAALIRTLIDRTVGWRASRIAKRYTTTSKNSMGRVQTPTLGFIVERELAREAHVPVRYFEVAARTELADFAVRFHEKTDAQAWVDEKHRFNAHRTSNAALAESAFGALDKTRQLVIEDVTQRKKSQRPLPAFSTDSLLQAAGSRWGWSPKKTSALAGQLYESGHLTYIRTDSTRLAKQAVAAGRKLIEKTWGPERLGPGGGAGGGAGAQDAHEAIRPTRLERSAVPGVEHDVQRLYQLVRARTLASLMGPSFRITLSLRASCKALELPLEGSVGWYAELGWRCAFDSLDSGAPTTPIAVSPGQVAELLAGEDEAPNPQLHEDATKPPARYRPHTLVRAMKEAGIGRPSTYAKTVEVLEGRRYISSEDGGLAPTKSGRNIWLEAAPLFALPDQREAFQTEYTATMEALLDDVAEGKRPASEVWETMLEEFKSAHAAAQEASKSGPIVPRTRQKLLDYLEAAPELASEIGDLDALSEQAAKQQLAVLRARGISLLPSASQRAYLDKLLEATGLTLEAAMESADLLPGSESLDREAASALIDHLAQLKAERQVPSPKQLRWIADLAKKAKLDQAAAAKLVGARDFSELSGGPGGTASALIDLLKPKRGSGAKGRA